MSPINRIAAGRVGPPTLPIEADCKPGKNQGKQAFADHLRDACRELGVEISFTKHAVERVQTRKVPLSQEQLERIDRAAAAAADRGGNTALVMLDDIALIVGLKDRRVITVVDGNSLKNNVFTAIDSAVIA